MEVPGVSDNVQVSERILFASWHCGVFGTTAPAILTGCYQLCLISTPPGLMPDNCNRLLPLPRPLAARSPQLTSHCAFTSQRWNRECSQRYLRPTATTPLRLRRVPLRHVAQRLSFATPQSAVSQPVVALRCFARYVGQVSVTGDCRDLLP